MGSLVLLFPTILIPPRAYFSCSFLVPGVPDSVFWRSCELDGGRVSAGDGMAQRKGEQSGIRGWESPHLLLPLPSLLRHSSGGERRGSKGGHWNKER